MKSMAMITPNEQAENLCDGRNGPSENLIEDINLGPVLSVEPVPIGASANPITLLCAQSRE